jgi:hypothetical protein
MKLHICRFRHIPVQCSHNAHNKHPRHCNKTLPELFCSVPDWTNSHPRITSFYALCFEQTVLNIRACGSSSTGSPSSADHCPLHLLRLRIVRGQSQPHTCSLSLDKIIWQYCLTVLFFFPERFRGLKSGQKFDQRGVVCYTKARQKGSGTPFQLVLLRKNFRNGVLTRSVTKIPFLFNTLNHLNNVYNFSSYLKKTQRHPTQLSVGYCYLKK